MMEKLLAQNPINLGGTIGGPGLGPFARSYTDGTDALTAITGIVSKIIGLMTIAAGIWFLFQFIIGGFFWITSAGDKAKLETAHHRINDALVGLIIVVIGWAILALASQFFGVDFLLTKPGDIIQKLGF